MSKKATQDALAKRSEAGAITWQTAAKQSKAPVAKFTFGAPRVSFKGGRVNVDGQPVKDNKLPIIVIDTVLAKAYYEEAYEEGKAATPACYAFHPSDEKALTPHEAAPKKQHDRCFGCPHNVFGTSDVGRGKRCRDEVRVIGIVPTDTDYKGAEARLVTITGNSLKTWSEYLSKLDVLGTFPEGVITEMSTEPFKSAFRITFNRIGDITKEQYDTLQTRVPVAREQLMQPYPVINDGEGEAPKKQAKGRGKF